MTTLRNLTAVEVSTLAGIIAKLRPHGARRWDPAGIRAALAKVADYDAADALLAAIRLSQDRTAETPGQIAITSAECWRERLAEPGSTRRPFDRQRTCGTCGYEQAECERRWSSDHAFEPIPASARNAIALPPDTAGELHDLARPAPATTEPPTGGSSLPGGDA